MTHREVRMLSSATSALAKYLVDSKEDNFYLNYGVDRNLTILSAASEVILKNAPKELVELEKEAYEKYTATLEEGEAQTEDAFRAIQLGLSLLGDEKSKVYERLSSKFIEWLEDENDIQLYMLDIEKLSNIKMDYQYMTILKNFIK